MIGGRFDIPGYFSRDINVLALVKGQERYVFLYDDDNRAETLRQLGRFASREDLSFTWYDAAVLSQKIRQEKEEQDRIHNNEIFKDLVQECSIPNYDGDFLDSKKFVINDIDERLSFIYLLINKF